MDEIKNDDVFPAGIQSSGQMIRNLNWRLLESEREKACLRTELTHAREMNAAAMLDVAAARRALAMEIERHNRFVATLQYTIHAMSEALTAAAEQARNPPAPVKPIVYADWTPPAGLPRGIR